MSVAPRRRYLHTARMAADERGAAAVLADIGAHLGAGQVVDLPLATDDPDPALAPPPELAAPEMLGWVYEAVLQPSERRGRGAFYTPEAVAAELAAATLDGLGAEARVWDPAVGGGALLLAAARALIARGADPGAVVATQLGGVDIDPLAVDVTVTALGLLGGALPLGVAVGDGLTPPSTRWDAVVANPPFLGQLKNGTARSRAVASALGERFGSAAGGYVDDAGLFLLAGLDAVRDGGMVGFVLPAPLVATRDGASVRQRAGAVSSLERMWSPPTRFEAGVRVVLAVARKTGAPGAGPWGQGQWSLLAGGRDSPPEMVLRDDGVVGDVASATADFRDQYYGVAGAAVDGGDGPALITCGLIDPAVARWGSRPARIGHRTFAAPRAGPLPAALQSWASARLVPKVVVATQTRVIEAAADEAGTWLPVVPVISVVPSGCDLWSLLAVLLAPPVAAHARRVHAGAALSPDAIKLSARQVAALPLPADRVAWAQGAAAARAATVAGQAGETEGWRAALGELAGAMSHAYGADASAWWWERIDRLEPLRRT